jgi:hypothetical protein
MFDNNNEKMKQKSVWNRYWSLSSSHDLIKMMISCWKKMMTRDIASIKTTSFERKKKTISWNVILIVHLLLISVQLKIADFLRKITFENSLTETKSLSRSLYMRNETRHRRISTIKKWSRCSKDCRQSLTKIRRWLIINKSNMSGTYLTTTSLVSLMTRRVTLARTRTRSSIVSSSFEL